LAGFRKFRNGRGLGCFLKNRGDCDSFEPTPEIITDFVAVAMECRPGALGVLDELVIKTQTAIAPE